jgi:hypothetical protein
MGVQVDLAIFHASPEPLDKNIVPLGAVAVRADLDFVDAHKGGNIGTGELRHRFSWSRQSCRVQAENPPIPGVQLCGPMTKALRKPVLKVIRRVDHPAVLVVLYG